MESGFQILVAGGGGFHGLELLELEEDHVRETMDGYFRQVGIRPRITSEVDEPAAVEDFVAAGLGVAFIPGLLKPTTPHTLTARVAITDPPCELTLCLAWNTDRYLSVAARAFRDHVIAHFVAASARSAWAVQETGLSSRRPPP